MEIREALDLVRAEYPRSEADQSEAVAKHAAAYLDAFAKRVRDDEEYEFSDREAAALFHLCEELRFAADQFERDLLRHLKWGSEGMTWQQVSETVEGQLGGRQAMQKRWHRLTDHSRRTTTGDMRRGAAAAGSTARRSTVFGVDTTTPTEDRS
ncbi:hypothetical protein [Pseudonocardia sp. McavD-2-B]|uniref:hypothetical protein n=1 Tax=Pseudonocardia sp. McavD-2-B TaxID=2954499 RepID=UPI00209773F6|nr:hypothetical protein [Pseudonocardia sp. McavD-2-B]MCO7196263.1 hypothetical protein [Pseudonocardia sp. McavD-2-B]